MSETEHRAPAEREPGFAKTGYSWELDPPGSEEYYGYAVSIWHTGGADREHGGHLLGQLQVVVIDEFHGEEDEERVEAMKKLATRIAEFLNKEEE